MRLNIQRAEYLAFLGWHHKVIISLREMAVWGDGGTLRGCQLISSTVSCLGSTEAATQGPTVSSEGPASEGLAFLKGLLRINDLSVTSWLDARMLLASPEQALTHQNHVGGWDPCGYSQDLISKPPTVTSAQACASESPRPWVDGVGSAKKELLPGKPRALVKTLCRLILGSLKPFFLLHSSIQMPYIILYHYQNRVRWLQKTLTNKWINRPTVAIPPFNTLSFPYQIFPWTCI